VTSTSVRRLRRRFAPLTEFRCVVKRGGDRGRQLDSIRRELTPVSPCRSTIWNVEKVLIFYY
jgi:hypothetical protein